MALNDAMTRGDDIALVEAVTMNYRLWLFFYSEIESGRVSLPADVAGNIITLVGYVVKVAPRACAGERKVIETLISINRNIAAGLSEGAANTPEPSALPAGETTTFSASV
jgi:flagellar protein FlaF